MQVRDRWYICCSCSVLLAIKNFSLSITFGRWLDMTFCVLGVGGYEPVKTIRSCRTGQLTYPSYFEAGLLSG